MKTYKIVYCFTDTKGIIETDENGEVIYTFITKANTIKEAVANMFKEENFKEKPDILDVQEVKL